MNKFKLMFYLLIYISLTLACTQTKTNKVDSLVAETSSANPSLFTVKDTLDYTSGIRSIFHDSKGNYWIGSHEEGVCLFDGKSFTYFTVDNGLSDNQVRTIQEDENGTIWFGTGNGVSSFNGKEIANYNPISRFTEFRLNKIGNWKITDNSLWFDAGNESGVYRFDGEKLTFLDFPVQGDISTSNIFGATGFSKGKNGSIWIATYAAALSYDGESFKIIDDKYLANFGLKGKLHIRSILEDSKGKLWIGNNGIGVLLTEGEKTINFSKKQNLIHFNSSRNGRRSQPGTLEHVFAIGEDSYGNIWFGDRDTGAWKYDGNEMTNYTIDDKLATQHIWEIYEDRNGELLFAMGNGGVYRFNENSFERKF